MLPGSLIYEAWISISANRLRTFLAMLGIVIGVSSVVLMVAVGTGSSRKVAEAIRQLGTNLLIVTPGSASNKGVRSIASSRFSVRDAQILGQLPSVAYAAAFTDYRNFQLRSSLSNWNAGAVGTTEHGIRIRNWPLAEGSEFSAEDVQNGKRVMVIGNTVARELCGGLSCVGTTILINNISFAVIGVLEARGQSLDGRDQDNIIFLPITTAQSKLWGNSYSSIVQSINARAIAKDYVTIAAEEIRSALRDRFRIKNTDGDNFTITDLTAITKIASDTTKSMSMLLAAIASISLIVGGIGIMNIMLVTVSERTREIGIRKAIGASERAILSQFLLEAIFIAFVGSLIGLSLGAGLGLLASSQIGLPVDFSIWAVVSALLVASGVGIASGIYPAYKAAKLQPIEALRVG